MYFVLLRASSESCVVCRNDTCFKYDDDDNSIAIIQRVLQVPSSSNMTTMMMRILSWSSRERHARTISFKSPRDSTAPLPPLNGSELPERLNAAVLQYYCRCWYYAGIIFICFEMKVVTCCVQTMQELKTRRCFYIADCVV